MSTDRSNKKAIISSLMGVVICGGLPERLNYTGVLAGRVENYLVTELLGENDRARYIKRVYQSIQSTINNTVQLAFIDRKMGVPLKTKELEAFVHSEIFHINESWNTEEAASDMELMASLAEIRMARQYCQFASKCAATIQQQPNTYVDAYPKLTENLEDAIRIISNICDKWDLIGYDSSGWTKRIDETVSRLHTETGPQEVT